MVKFKGSLDLSTANTCTANSRNFEFPVVIEYFDKLIYLLKFAGNQLRLPEFVSFVALSQLTKCHFRD